MKIINLLNNLLINSMRFLGHKCHSSFLLLLIPSVDDEAKQIRFQAKRYWEMIKRKSIFYGNYSILRSTLMSTFLSILGNNKINYDNNDDNNNNEEKSTDNRNFNFTQKNELNSFSDFKDGNNEIKLKNLLNLFIGLGDILGNNVRIYIYFLFIFTFIFMLKTKNPIIC